MIDHRAIEATEKLIDGYLQEGKSKDDPTIIALCRLRKAFVRPWVEWLTENRDQSEVVLDASASFVAGVLAELVMNYFEAGHYESGMEQMLVRVAELAANNIYAIRAVTEEGVSEEAIDVIRKRINLRGKSDA